MRLRNLRVAWSVMCGVFCLLLIALWERSYWWCDVVEGTVTSSRGFRLASESGDVGGRLFNTKGGWRIYSVETAVLNSRTGWNPSGFYWSWQLGPWVQVRHWFALMLVATCAVVPWIRWRFSLRTLLIAATVVAVILGLTVMMLRGS
jgi:hypothetical protein